MASAPVRQQTIQEGRFTLVYPNGDYRTVKIKLWAGPRKLVLSLKKGNGWEACGFVQPNGTISFWTKFKVANPPDRLHRIQVAVNRILADPEKAGLSYAMEENRCYRCGKELTVPASIHKGMGPDCAKRAVTRDLNKQAYDWRASQAPPPVPVQTTIPFTSTAPEAVSASSGTAEDEVQKTRRSINYAIQSAAADVMANCEECKRGSPVSHFGSERCRSGSLASGGKRAHCTCDTCF